MMSRITLENPELTLWQVLGPAVPGLLKDSGISIPEVMTAITTDNGFVARLGQDEFLIQASQPPLAEQPLCWTYTRGDRVVALQGDAWRSVMAQICHMDFSTFHVGEWLMVAAAGINVWCLVWD